MGFVYNNYWERLCRTYLELNGFFVMSNVFVSLFVPEHASTNGDHDRHEPGERRLEADLIAFKTASIDLDQFKINLDCPPYLSRNPEQNEFLAGTQGVARLVYLEVRAYLQSPRDGLSDHLKDDATILSKIEKIEARFKTRAEIVLVGHGISEKSKESIRRRERWAFKELKDIFWFVADRFQKHGEKLAAVYNDPCLEAMRGFFGPAPLAYLKRDEP